MAKKKIEKDTSVLTVEEALSLLAPHKEGRKQRVHSFISTSFALMGCDMDLTHVKRELKNAFAQDNTNIRLSGKQMGGLGHGLAYFQTTIGWTFLETDKYKVNQILLSRGEYEMVIPAKTHIKGERKVR